MRPIDPAGDPASAELSADVVVPAQALAHGGTFVRPGAVAWGGTRDAPDGAYSSREFVEQILAAAARDADRVDDLLEELAQARLWVPLPAGGPVTDGSAVALPTVTYLGAEFVPCFTSVRHASRAWLSVPGQGEGLIISVALDDPASEPAREAVLDTIERAAAAVSQQTPFPIDVTFPGESEPDLVDDWVARNTRPFYTRDQALPR